MVQYVRVVEGPTPEQSRGVAQLIILGIVGLGLYWLWQKVNAWESLDAPYSYISAFYYYVVVLPIKSFAPVWDWLQSSGLTPFPNLNFCLSILGIVTYAFIILAAIGVVIAILEEIGVNKDVLSAIFFLPAIVAFFWFILSFVFLWLFSY